MTVMSAEVLPCPGTVIGLSVHHPILTDIICGRCYAHLNEEECCQGFLGWGEPEQAKRLKLWGAKAPPGYTYPPRPLTE